MIQWVKIFGIITATFVSEDLTCISTGLLIRSGHLALSTGLSACIVGIFLGDLGLFFLGKAMRFGIFSLPALQQRMGNFEHIGKRLRQEGWKLIILARFVPGLRLPVYVGAGFLGGRAHNMAIFALGAGMIWTPALVLLSAWIGPGIKESFAGSWLGLLIAIVIIYVCLRCLLLALSREGRRRLHIRFQKLFAIEFWPPLLFYAPLIPGWLYWSLRYRGFHTITTSNPGIEGGGVVGESKAAILEKLLSPLTLDWLLIPSDAAMTRQRPQADPLRLRTVFLKKGLSQKSWSYPFILKPNQAERGNGVKLIRNFKEAQAYLAQVPQEVLAQVYHPGPLEAGIFYYRKPQEKEGMIFSITDKVFPVLIGDGRSTIEELIWAHPRYRMQSNTFISRLADRKEKLVRILKKGERLPLALAGNHIQGTMFLDGSHLYSEALRKKIDTIARNFSGFYFGRFDVRYQKKEDLRRGRGFYIVELNGATSESTNIYDPRFSISQVYRTLYKQWQLLFDIAYQNRKAKAPLTSPLDLIRLSLRHRKMQKIPKISD